MLKEKRQGIYLAKETIAIMGDTAATSVSGRVNQIIQRYGEIISEVCPALTQGEWCLLFDLLNGTIMDNPRYLWAEVDDSIRMDGLADKWQVDGAALVVKLRGMTPEQGYAILETVARFWQCDFDDQMDWVKKILAAGGKLA